MNRSPVVLSAPVPADLRAKLEAHHTLIDVPVGQNPLDRLDDDAKRHVVGILCTVGTRVDESLMTALPSLRVVSNFAVGFDNIDVESATRRGIVVCNTPEVLDGAVADLTFGFIIGLARDLVRGDAYVRDGSWARKGPPPLAQDIRGKTLGILGMGRIGQVVARTAQAFDMRVIYHNRNRCPQAESAGLAQYCDRDALFAESDFVSVHVPLTEATRESIGRHELALMKPTAYLINTGRGAVLDEAALVQALRDGTIAGAGLDVMVEEPLPMDHALCTLPNVILQAHIGSATVETRRAMITLATHNLLDALRNARPAAMVNPEAWQQRPS